MAVSGITLIQKLQKLFGARAVSDMMGRTTNVQTLAQGTNNPFARSFSPKYLANNPDGVEEASKVILENMQFAFGNKNIQQMKNFEYNVDTLYNMKFPKTTTSKEADIIDIKTKSKVDDKGIMQLKDDLGLPEGVSPKSPMGKNLQDFKKVTKEVELKGKQLDKDIDTSLQDVVEGMFGKLGKTVGDIDIIREGQRRAVIRQIMLKDKKIRLPADKFDDLLFSRDLSKGTDAEDPLKLLDKYYERDMDKLEELDDIIDSTSGPIEAADTFLKKGGFRTKKPIVRESLDDETVEMTEKNLLDDSDDDIPFAQGGIAGQLHMNDGGRVGLEKGGPSNPGRRNFMKLMAGLASIPVLGKFFKLAKPAAKVVQLKNTSTAMPTWFPKFVDKFVNNSVGKKIDADLMEFKNSDLPNVKVTRHDDGRVYVEGNNEYNEGYQIEYKPPGYEVVDEKTGKAVKTPGDFDAVEGRHVALGPEDYDTDAFYVDDLDELTTIDVAEMEKYSTGKVTKTVKDAFGTDTKVKKGVRDYDMAVGKAENEADVLRDADLLDEDLAKGGLAGQLNL